MSLIVQPTLVRDRTMRKSWFGTILLVVSLCLVASFSAFGNEPEGSINFDGGSGLANRCYVVTRDGIHLRDRAAGVDTDTGLQCRSLTPEVLERIRAYRFGNRPSKLTTADP